MTETFRRLRLVVAATGSTGDVRPLLLLATALEHAGHDVRTLAPPHYEELATEMAISDFRPIWLGREEIIQAQARSNDEQQNHLDDSYFNHWFACYPDIREACRDAQALVGRYAVFEGFARLEGIPFLHAANVPPLERPGAALPRVVAGSDMAGLATWHRRASVLPGGRGIVNLSTHLYHLGLSPLQAWRDRAALKVLASLPRRQREALQALAETPEERRRLTAGGSTRTVRLYGLSSILMPPQGGHYTGLWHSDIPPRFTPPRELEAFLSEGSPPVLVSFGSNPCTRKGRDFTWISEIVAKAVKSVGCRALLQGGWGGLHWPAGQQRPGHDQVLQIGDVPHEWLFRRVAAVVHHGGAGTSLEALWQGLPSVVVPFVNDQFFWAWKLHDLGVAPPPFEADVLDPGRLAVALRRAIDDPALRRAAGDLSSRLRQEQGLAAAVAAIEREVAATTCA